MTGCRWFQYYEDRFDSGPVEYDTSGAICSFSRDGKGIHKVVNDKGGYTGQSRILLSTPIQIILIDNRLELTRCIRHGVSPAAISSTPPASVTSHDEVLVKGKKKNYSRKKKDKLMGYLDSIVISKGHAWVCYGKIINVEYVVGF